MCIRCGSEIKYSDRVGSTKCHLLSFLSGRKAHRNQEGTACETCGGSRSVWSKGWTVGAMGMYLSDLQLQGL